MPQSPYAKLRASINGGAVQMGGITVTASATVQLSADPSAAVGATQYKYEIYGYPIGFAQPSGWSTDSSGVYFYSSGSTPPIFTLPTIANWGKFMLRLTLNNAISINPQAIPVTQLVDESTALSMLSPTGLADVGLYESNQFNSTWTPALQASLRAVDGAVTAVASANVKQPAKLVSIGNIASLSGEQTIDSVLTTASRVLLTGQTTASQNGLWVTGSGAWTRPTDFNTDAQVIVGQTVFVTSGTTYSSSNWQMTVGSTIAGSKTYAQLAATSKGILAAANVVSTANVSSLSGEQTIDGVTTSSSRVLLSAQATTSQNGLWLSAAGAWSRPSDFNADAQVVVGQTVYIISGTINANTNWQLASGSTIAGAKVYNKIQTISVSGVGPVDVVDTSNVTTSGLTAIDGVTLISGATRILLVAQTTTSQNGVWVANPGAWTRPADFNADAQVIVGQTVYVKPGGLTVGDTNWQLKTGTTIAGAKTYARVTSANTIVPVDYVQQFHLGYGDPDWVYSSGPQTLTAAVNGVINTKFFGTTNIVGKRLEVNYSGVADARAGIYVGVSNGSVSTPASMVRASDFARTVDLANGARYLVLSGVFAGTQRAMQTVAPVLDTTPILLDRVRAQSALEIDLSAPPYNVRDYASYGDWYFDRNQVDNGPILTQFLADYANTGVVGRLPAANGGVIVCSTPVIRTEGGPFLRGAGKRASTLLGLMSGGPLLIAAKLTPPQLSAFTLDTATHSTAISFDVDANGNAATPYWLNLTHGGVLADSWSNFEYTAIHRWGSGGTSADSVSSCRGMRNIPSGTATSLQDILDTMFELLHDGPSQRLTAKLRVWDQTKGVYGAVTHTGTGTSVMTGDATIKPTADAPIVVRVVAGGTVGVNGIVLQFSNNAESGVGITWSKTFALGTATSITITHPTMHLEQGTWKFNFAAGTMVAGDTYYSNCTGTLQTITIASDVANPVLPNTNYVVTVQYDGANMRMYITKPGFARDTGTNTANHAVTGVVRQYPWEQWMIGTAQNAGLVEGIDGQPAGPMFLGSVSLLSSGVAVPPSTAPTTLTRTGAERFFFQPTSDNAIKTPDGVVRAWHGYNKNSDAVIVPRSNYPVVRQQIALGGFEDFGTNMGDIFGTNRMGMGLLSVAWNQYVFRNMVFAGGLHGRHHQGPEFFSDEYDISYEVTWGPALTAANCGLTMHGKHQFANSAGPMLIATANCALASHGTLVVNCELSPGAINLCDYGTLAPIVMLNCTFADIAYLEIDPENQSLGPQGRELMCCSVQNVLQIRSGFASLDFSKYNFLSLGSSPYNGQVYCGQMVLEAGNSSLPYTAVSNAFTIRDTKAPPIKLGPDFRTAGNNFNSLCDRPGYVVKAGGLLPSAALTDANATLLYADPNGAGYSSVRNSYKMAAGTTTANRTITLQTLEMQESDLFRITLGAQGNTVTIKDGGPAGTGTTTVITAPVGFMGALEFRMNQAGNLEWV